MKTPPFVLLVTTCFVMAAAGPHATATMPAVSATPAATPTGRVAPPAAWLDWARWVNDQYPVADKDGHGPDIGSDEWAGAIDKRLHIRDAQGHGPELKSKEWRAAVEQQLTRQTNPGPKEERQLLAAHDTVARFDGLTDHKCMGRTSLCPDRCGESGKLATFTIVKYLRYEKPGEYGDAKQGRFMVLVEDTMKNRKVPVAMHDAIMALKTGETVRLAWNHDYVTRKGSKFPERPIRSLTVLSADEAKKLLEK